MGWLAVLHWETQQSLQWWFEQQQQWLCQEAEQIRNGLLQETFVMRRRLEVKSINGKDGIVQEHHAWIDQINYLSQHLVRLSDTLSPPYLEASLPLALQAWADQTKTTDADRSKTIVLHLPTVWHPESVSQSRILLASLNHAFHLGHCSGVEGLIQLQANQSWVNLTVRLSYPTVDQAVKVARSRDLRYLMRAFQVLMPGRSAYQRQQHEIDLRFQWRSLQHQSKPHSKL